MSADPCRLDGQAAASPDDTQVRELRSERLLLRRSDAVQPQVVLEFFARNVAHLERWLPEARPIAENPGFQSGLLQRTRDELAAGNEERWFVLAPRDEARVLGYVFLTQFRRDGHRSCELAYGIDVGEQGQGLMREAIERALHHVQEHLKFSCVNARYDVENFSSARLLEGLGFVRIGIAPAHAWLAGAWRDHVLVTRVRRMEK